MIRAVRHIGLVTPDLKNSSYFWCSVMGFIPGVEVLETGSFIDSLLGLNDVNVTTSKLRSPCGQLLELLYFHSHNRLNNSIIQPYSNGFTHIALSVTDIEDQYCKVSEFGLSFNSPPTISPNGRVKAVYFRSPEGAFVELVEDLIK